MKIKNKIWQEILDTKEINFNDIIGAIIIIAGFWLIDKIIGLVNLIK